MAIENERSSFPAGQGFSTKKNSIHKSWPIGKLRVRTVAPIFLLLLLLLRTAHNPVQSAFSQSTLGLFASHLLKTTISHCVSRLLNQPFDASSLFKTTIYVHRACSINQFLLRASSSQSTIVCLCLFSTTYYYFLLRSFCDSLSAQPPISFAFGSASFFFFSKLATVTKFYKQKQNKTKRNAIVFLSTHVLTCPSGPPSHSERRHDRGVAHARYGWIRDENGSDVIYRSPICSSIEKFDCDFQY